MLNKERKVLIIRQQCKDSQKREGEVGSIQEKRYQSQGSCKQIFYKFFVSWPRNSKAVSSLLVILGTSKKTS